jgi:hypothetical protein
MRELSNRNNNPKPDTNPNPKLGFFLPMALQPVSGLDLLFLRFLNHTQLDTR